MSGAIIFLGSFAEISASGVSDGSPDKPRSRPESRYVIRAEWSIVRLKLQIYFERIKIDAATQRDRIDENNFISRMLPENWEIFKNINRII